MGLELQIREWLHNRQDSREILLDELLEVDERWFACVRMVAVSLEDGSWSLFFGEAVISPEETPGPHLDFGRIVAVAECLSVKDFAARLQGSFTTGRFPCGRIEVDVSKMSRQWSFCRYGSDGDYSPWPCVVASGSTDRGSVPTGPFVAPIDGAHRYFENPFDIVEEVRSFPVYHGGMDARLWKMSVVIEDRRGRIRKVERDGETLKVHVDGGPLEGLVLCGEARGTGDRVDHFSPAVQPEVQVPIPEGPVRVGMAIVGEGDEVLDTRSGQLHAPSPIVNEGAPIPEVELADQVAKLLLDGENAYCEFKPWVEPRHLAPKFTEIAKTAVAMANSDGGSIIVGADDHGGVMPREGRIMGPFVQQAKETGEPDDEQPDRYALELEAVRLYGRKLRDEVQKLVEPSVELKLEVVMLHRGPVLLVEIRAGSRRPYMISETNEVYVRRNATNRRPTREELRSLHEPAI